MRDAPAPTPPRPRAPWPDDLDDSPLVLPDPPAPPARPPLPVLTALVPVVGAVVLWMVTGSPFALWFAALGPLLAASSIVDAARTARRTRRRAARESAVALTRAERELVRRHDVDRTRRWERHPDVAGFCAGDDQVWRVVPGRDGAVVVGRGELPAGIRVDGGEAAARAALSRRASRLGDAPITLPLTGGIAVVGPAVPAAAVARGIVLQACLSHPPGTLGVAAGGPAWTRNLPHAAATAPRTVALVGPGRPVPPGVDAPVIVVPRATPAAPVAVPPRCAAVLTLTGAASAVLDHAGSTRDIVVEAVSEAQAVAVAATLAQRAAALEPQTAGATALDALLAEPPPTGASLWAAIGSDDGALVGLDLVTDGPHAIVVGMTGSGKSELLTTWVTALAAHRPPTALAFLLVDFKGGRTFEHLEALPHVTGVLTDLDEAAAVRAIESLRAEIRHRERALAEVGTRDVAEAGGAIGRLVVVVDEYAALVAAHPELHDLFGDIAARGRALGIHLILASQRAGGVFRDAVLANSPLRIALRVADPADSRAALGVDDAVRLRGGAAHTGRALVRRSADTAAVAVHIALCARHTVARVAAEHAGRRARAPWLPALPERLALADLRGIAATDDAGPRAADGSEAVLLGLADLPEQQAQPVRTLPTHGLVLVGRAGSGKTTALALIAAQHPAALVHRIPADPEAAWDAITACVAVPAGTVVLADDLDALPGRLPPDYAVAALEALEACVREASARGVRVVLTARRLTGAVARVADLIPARAVLAQASRADHAAAGGDGATFQRDAPAGRCRLDGTLVQLAVPDPAAAPSAGRAPVAPWRPRGAVAFVAPAGARTREVLRTWQADGRRIVGVDDPHAALVRGTVVWGTPEAWLAQWRLLAAARAGAHLLIDAACAAEYRAVTGSRDLPPYALAGARRAWLLGADGRAVERVVLAAGERRTTAP